MTELYADRCNLCRQELALLELKAKAALMQDRAQLLAGMQQLDRDMRSQGVPVPDRWIPVLERISRDPGVMNDARILAGRIADGIRASKVNVNRRGLKVRSRSAAFSF